MFPEDITISRGVVSRIDLIYFHCNIVCTDVKHSTWSDLKIIIILDFQTK